MTLPELLKIRCMFEDTAMLLTVDAVRTLYPPNETSGGRAEEWIYYFYFPLHLQFCFAKKGAKGEGGDDFKTFLLNLKQTLFILPICNFCHYSFLYLSDSKTKNKVLKSSPPSHFTPLFIFCK